MGSEIVLRRIVKKLFNHFNELQPTELDDEFIYQSAITYDDYLGLLKYSRDEQPLNCASLSKLENILSNFISTAAVNRPIHTSLFGGMSLDRFAVPISMDVKLMIVLFMVGLIAVFLQTFVKIRSAWKSWALSVIIVGFVEFCMQKNEIFSQNRLNLEKCRNPSWIARLTSLISYDYDNCRADNQETLNIAMATVEYLSELIFQPLVQLGAKLGKGLNLYLNQFSGFNYLLSFIFPVISILGIIFIIPYLLSVLLSSRRERRTNHRPIQNSPRKAIKKK